MATQTVRVGIIGAGSNTRLRHIPGFRAIDGVEIIGVVNSTPESTERAAQEHGIAKTYLDWRALLADPQIDAVMIGTWPNLHCPITCAALETGKHVLTEARMARNASEAHKMLNASQDHPDLVAQIVPSPLGLKYNDFVRGLLEDGFIGELRELIVIGTNDMFWDYTKPIHWRQDAKISGFNTLSLGILQEAADRWIPPAVRVFAQSTIFELQRAAVVSRDAVGTENVEVTIPESVQIVTEIEGGARGLYHLSGVEMWGPGHQIHMYGSLGTIKYQFTPQERVLIGRIGDEELHVLQLPPEKQGDWRVEAEFIGAIRGQEPVRLTDFATGVRYMEFTEAVHRSTQTDQPVSLPLADFA